MGKMACEEAEVERYANAGREGNDEAPKGPVGRHKEDDPNWRAKTAEGESTLADIKRRQREELIESLEESQQKRFKITNFTSEDSHVVGEQKLLSLYCQICGEHCLTSEVDCMKLPR